VRFALVVHPDRESAADIAARLVVAAAGHGIEVRARPEDAARVPGAIASDETPRGDDVIVAVGGDGTMLEAVRIGLAADRPVLGVNAGHVGFLALVEPSRLDQAVAAVAAGEWSESLRMTVASHSEGAPPATGLNDVVVEKEVSQHTVRIAVSVGEERLVEYRADAVIVASPTGSTAYTFSAGGPLVDPELEALVVTAVAPHNLFSRPIVFRPGAALRLTVEGDRPVRVNVDGRASGRLEPGDWVDVRPGERPARFVTLTPRIFAASVRDKFRLHDA
jgi:NAD+ kinase